VVPILFIVGAHPEALSCRASPSASAGRRHHRLIVVVGNSCWRRCSAVAGPDSREFFMAATLLVSIGTGVSRRRRALHGARRALLPAC